MDFYNWFNARQAEAAAPPTFEHTVREAKMLFEIGRNQQSYEKTREALNIVGYNDMEDLRRYADYDNPMRRVPPWLRQRYNDDARDYIALRDRLHSIASQIRYFPGAYPEQAVLDAGNRIRARNYAGLLQDYRDKELAAPRPPTFAEWQRHQRNLAQRQRNLAAINEFVANPDAFDWEHAA